MEWKLDLHFRSYMLGAGIAGGLVYLQQGDMKGLTLAALITALSLLSLYYGTLWENYIEEVDAS